MHREHIAKLRKLSVSCEFCGKLTHADTLMFGNVICEPCLIHEVTTFVSIPKHELEKALAISPKKAN